MAAKLRRELKAEVEMVRGRYGDFEVLVDGDRVIGGGAGTVFGLVPSGTKVVAAVRERLARATPQTAK